MKIERAQPPRSGWALRLCLKAVRQRHRSIDRLINRRWRCAEISRSRCSSRSLVAARLAAERRPFDVRSEAVRLVPHWNGSDRRDRLPENWPQLRARVLKRDGYRCTAHSTYGDRCEFRATDVDHIRPGDDHRETNLSSLCAWHHARKSGAEGAAAVQRKRARARARFKRSEVHPGLIER